MGDNILILLIYESGFNLLFVFSKSTGYKTSRFAWKQIDPNDVFRSLQSLEKLKINNLTIIDTAYNMLNRVFDRENIKLFTLLKNIQNKNKDIRITKIYNNLNESSDIFLKSVKIFDETPEDDSYIGFVNFFRENVFLTSEEIRNVRRELKLIFNDVFENYQPSVNFVELLNYFSTNNIVQKVYHDKEGDVPFKTSGIFDLFYNKAQIEWNKKLDQKSDYEPRFSPQTVQKSEANFEKQNLEYYINGVNFLLDECKKLVEYDPPLIHRFKNNCNILLMYCQVLKAKNIKPSEDLIFMGQYEETFKEFKSLENLLEWRENNEIPTITNELYLLLLSDAGMSFQRLQDIKSSLLKIIFTILYYGDESLTQIGDFTKQDCIEFFKTLKLNKNFSEVDKKLIELLHFDIKNYFQNDRKKLRNNLGKKDDLKNFKNMINRDIETIFRSKDIPIWHHYSVDSFKQGKYPLITFKEK